MQRVILITVSAMLVGAFFGYEPATFLGMTAIGLLLYYDKYFGTKVEQV